MYNYFELSKHFFCYIWLPFCSEERSWLGNFDRGLYEEHLYEIILSVDLQFRVFKIFLFF